MAGRHGTEILRTILTSRSRRRPLRSLNDNFTMEAWITSTNANVKTLYSFQDQASTPEIDEDTTPGTIRAIISGTVMAETATGTLLDDGRWHQIVYTKNGVGSTNAIYVDGISQPLIINSSSSFANPTDDMFIGKRTDNNPWAGKMDELRVSNIARSSQWILTEYNNESSPSTFYAVGEAEPTD